ncbi:oxygen-independent coproporphyrinogen-3 oxidase [Acetitomaculum ruminis DSM 5522]|uniref:Heme chaperone HemW n=1 Tax=Acetitomaculum ruminis DSM 5522 TaxID=1120918 RepID=A0A1I0ZG02_9FIRM|nr:radical SAM family heme chaperone HemW [Acetitomaculum ruminis]SFB24575.1 oxygen-independent coproporphyrinogen-3 oxidase [Acetitomaculum ruminis DSM 5522]
MKRNQSKNNKSGIYIHIPFCVKKCNYCDFLSCPSDTQTIKDYINALSKEIRIKAECFKDKEIDTIFIGGGTPSILDTSLIKQVLFALRQNYNISSDCEFTIESNPKTLDREKLDLYLHYGINRLSIGLQSANDEELKLLGRIHMYNDFLESYHLARKAGISNINVDIMSALPKQSLESYSNTLKKVIDLKPEHISAYSLIIEENTPFYEKYSKDVKMLENGEKPEFLPDEDTERKMYDHTLQFLESNGYHRYEISNYSKKDKECRHNLKYWSRENYLGLGLGAASLLDDIRYKNLSDLKTYIKKYSDDAIIKDVFNDESFYDELTILDEKSCMEEFMFLGFRKMKGISGLQFQEYFEKRLEDVYGKVLEEFINKGLIIYENDYYFLSNEGINVSNYVLSKFLF